MRLIGETRNFFVYESRLDPLGGWQKARRVFLAFPRDENVMSCRVGVSIVASPCDDSDDFDHEVEWIEVSSSDRRKGFAKEVASFVYSILGKVKRQPRSEEGIHFRSATRHLG